MNVARKHPQVTPDIDNMLESLNTLGEKIAIKAGQDADDFVKTMLEKELTLNKAEDEVEEAFDLGEENA